MIKKIYEMDNIEIDNFIKQLLPVKKEEKNKFGEVFTPPELINKMLDLFPKNIWSNPKLKWLDPSVGVGFFMIFIYLRLMDGLKVWQPNKKKRSQFIINNMLFMVEINKKNCNICKSIFGPGVNLFCGDFLSVVKFKDYDDNTFDCIVGNPPYQDDYGLSNLGKRINGGKNKLYERIILKSYDMLKNKGYLSFVVPDNIFAGNGQKMYPIFLENSLPFVSFNSNNKLFFDNVQQQVCYFLMQKGVKPGLTNIESNDNLSFKLKLLDRPVNPIRNWTPKTEQLINKFVSNKRNNAIYNRGKNLSFYKGTKYPIIFTSDKIIYSNNKELASGIGQKKMVIFSISPELAFKMDNQGKYGAGPNTFYIPYLTNNQGKKLEHFLNSEDYKTLALATKTSRQYLKIAFIEHLNLTKIMSSKNTRKNIKSNSNKTRKLKY
jgi:hypothetical protein